MTDKKLTVLADSEPGIGAVSRAIADFGAGHFRVLERCGKAAANAENLLVLSAASRLQGVADCVSVANKAHRLAALLVYNDVDADWLPYVFHQSGLRTLRNMIVHSDPALPARVLNAWAIGGESDFIADAAVIGNDLVVRSCAFHEFRMAFDTFPALRALTTEQRSKFVLEEDGFLLYWPEFDVHLDLDDIRFAANPKARQAARTAQLSENQAIGSWLRLMRENAGLKQSDIEGMSDRHVRRIESGERVTSEALDAFAQALRLSSDDLLERLATGLRSTDPSIKPAFKSERDHLNKSPGRLDRSGIVKYPESRKRLRAPGGEVREELQLAADCNESPKDSNQSLDLPTGGHVQGGFEYDYQKDELYFVVREVDAKKGGGALSLVGHGPGLDTALRSNPFTPLPGTRVLLAKQQGIVPGDVTRLLVEPVSE